MRLIGKVRNVPRAAFLLVSYLGIALLLAGSFSCAPSRQNQSASELKDLPELTDEMIRERINYRRIRQIPEENEAAEPIGWTFIENEPKEITIVEKQIKGDHATIVLDIKTLSASNAREPRLLAGQIRTQWELRTGWALRRWEIVETENISMKYKNLPKPPASNSNH